MLVQILLICLLANFYLVESAEIIVGSVSRPKGISIEEHNQRIRDFWTPEKLKAAKSLDLVLPKLPTGRTSASNNGSYGRPSSIPGSLPTGTLRSCKDHPSNDSQVYTTGKVFFQDGGGLYACSASIVKSVSGDLVSTAGHCVYNTTGKVYYNLNWVFVPAYSNGSRPYGTWTARNFLAPTQWQNNEDFDYDVGFVALSTLNGKHIQAVLGSQGIRFNFPRLAYIYAFGYPGNLDGGNYLESCSGFAQNPTGADDYHGQRLPCNMTGGSSGGPWLQNVNTATGIGYETSLVSFGIDSVPNYVFGPYFGSIIKAAYGMATNM